MSTPRVPRDRIRLPLPANDNKPVLRGLRTVVLIPADSPIAQSEIEVFAALLDDWEDLAANDNEESAR